MRDWFNRISRGEFAGLRIRLRRNAPQGGFAIRPAFYPLKSKRVDAGLLPGVGDGLGQGVIGQDEDWLGGLDA